MVSAIANLDFSEVWGSLSGFSKILFLLFCGASVYTICLSVYAFFVLRSLKQAPARSSPSNVLSSVAILRNRLRNLRQLHLFLLLYLVFCAMVQIPATFHIFSIGDHPTYLTNGLISTLEFLFTYDAVLSFGLIILHCLQWAASSRVERFASTSLSSSA
jgi:cell division protein FtsL